MSDLDRTNNGDNVKTSLKDLISPSFPKKIIVFFWNLKKSFPAINLFELANLIAVYVDVFKHNNKISVFIKNISELPRDPDIMGVLIDAYSSISTQGKFYLNFNDYLTFGEKLAANGQRMKAVNIVPPWEWYYPSPLRDESITQAIRNYRKKLEEALRKKRIDGGYSFRRINIVDDLKALNSIIEYCQKDIKKNAPSGEYIKLFYNRWLYRVLSSEKEKLQYGENPETANSIYSMLQILQNLTSPNQELTRGDNPDVEIIIKHLGLSDDNSSISSTQVSAALELYFDSDKKDYLDKMKKLSQEISYILAKRFYEDLHSQEVCDAIYIVKTYFRNETWFDKLEQEEAVYNQNGLSLVIRTEKDGIDALLFTIQKLSPAELGAELNDGSNYNFLYKELGDRLDQINSDRGTFPQLIQTMYQGLTTPSG
jgi:hypothetical protein